MSNDLGLLELECDAPPYPVVRACRKLGMIAPEDVRWCGVSRVRKHVPSWVSFLAIRTWGRLLSRGKAEPAACTCGHSLPDLESYAFLFQSGDQVDYAMGQCPLCQTIYWEKM